MGKKGQATVEFALAAVVLFPLLFVIIELALMFYVNLTMQHAVREGTRYSITGQTGGSSSRRAALIKKIQDASNGLYAKNALPQEPTVSVLIPTVPNNFSNYTEIPVDTTGERNDVVIVSLTYAWPLLTPALKPFFPGGMYTFTVRATMKNEPWGG
jgi:Flp pilus assembly protein TadG